MTKLTLDRSVTDKLDSLRERIEIYDESGHRIGYFEPDHNRALYENIDVPFSEEDLKRWESAPGGRTLDEILRDLEDRWIDLCWERK